MSVWRKAGLSYATYLSVAAKTVRSALKPELHSAAIMTRSTTEAMYTQYDKGAPKADPAPLDKDL